MYKVIGFNEEGIKYEREVKNKAGIGLSILWAFKKGARIVIVFTSEDQAANKLATMMFPDYTPKAKLGKDQVGGSDATCRN